MNSALLCLTVIKNIMVDNNWYSWFYLKYTYVHICRIQIADWYATSEREPIAWNHLQLNDDIEITRQFIWKHGHKQMYRQKDIDLSARKI